jgi:hypothetical protein
MTNQPAQTQDLREALQSAGRKLAEAINDLQALEIRTNSVDIKGSVFNEKDARLVAFTKIELDGDTTVIVPMKDENGTLVPDPALLILHKESVENAMQYRSQIVNMVMDFFRQARVR